MEIESRNGTGSFTEFEVCREMMGLAIGSNGSNIHNARKVEGILKIEVEDPGKFRIYGESEKAVDAARCILEYVIESVAIPRHATKYVIGKNGANIKEIKNNSGVISLHVQNDIEPNPPKKDDIAFCRIVGRKVNVCRAKEMLKSRLTHLQKSGNRLENYGEMNFGQTFSGPVNTRNVSEGKPKNYGSRQFFRSNTTNDALINEPACATSKSTKKVSDGDDPEDPTFENMHLLDEVFKDDGKVAILLYEVLENSCHQYLLLVLMNDVLRLTKEDKEKEIAQWIFDTFINCNAPLKIKVPENEVEKIKKDLRNGELKWGFFPAIIRAEVIISNQVKALNILRNDCIEEYTRKFLCEAIDLSDVLMEKIIEKFSTEPELGKILKIIGTYMV